MSVDGPKIDFLYFLYYHYYLLRMSIKAKKVIVDDDFDEIVNEKKMVNFSYLDVMNNGGTSYKVKKYHNRPIVAVYNKDKIIVVKRQVNFFEKNGAYLFELKDEKYQYVFVGGSVVYEFNLIKDDHLKLFECDLGNSSVTYAYILGEKYTYFLSDEDLCAVKNEDFSADSDRYNNLKKIKFDLKMIDIFSDSELVDDIKNIKKNIEVIGSVYKKNGQEGDFDWHIKSGLYEDSLFLFNDDEKRNKWKKAGRGNAVIRKYNKYALKTPRSCGIVTGKEVGYDELTDEVKKKIDRCFEEIKEIIHKYNYKKVYYSTETPNGLLGTSIFKVGDKVISYITERIKELEYL